MNQFAVLALWLLNVTVETSGHLAFKSVAVQEGSGLQRWRLMAARPALWFGVICFVMEFVVWLAFVSVVPLAKGVLMSMINIAVVALAGRVFFGEKFTQLRLVGIGLIVLGVGVVGVA